MSVNYWIKIRRKFDYAVFLTWESCILLIYQIVFFNIIHWQIALVKFMKSNYIVFLDIFVPFEHVWINNLHMITLKVMNWIINSFPLKIFESINFKLDFFENFSLVSSERLFSLLVSFHCYVTSFVKFGLRWQWTLRCSLLWLISTTSKSRQLDSKICFQRLNSSIQISPSQTKCFMILFQDKVTLIPWRSVSTFHAVKDCKVREELN